MVIITNGSVHWNKAALPCALWRARLFAENVIRGV